MTTSATTRPPAPGPDCAAFADVLPVLDEEGADKAAAEALRAHLPTCTYCQAQLDVYDRLDAALLRAFDPAAGGPPSLEGGDILASIFATSAERDTQRKGSTMTNNASESGEPPLKPAAPPIASPQPPTRRRQIVTGVSSVAAVLLIALFAQLLFASHHPGPGADPQGTETPSVTASPGATASVTASPGATPAPTATPAPSGDPGVPASGNACNQLPGLAGAHPLYINNLDFPEDGVAAAAIVSPAGAPLQVAQYDACIHDAPPYTNQAPPDRVLQLLGVSSRGWQASATFPFDGNTPRACGQGQTCFSVSPQMYLLIEGAAAPGGGLFTFRLRESASAPLVSCDPGYFPYETYPTSISPYYGAQIPLPPSTRVGVPGWGTTDGILTYLCSGGDAASIEAFMQDNLPKNGWAPLTVNGVQLWKTTSYTPTLYIRVYPVSDPHRWQILSYTNSPNFG